MCMIVCIYIYRYDIMLYVYIYVKRQAAGPKKPADLSPGAGSSSPLRLDDRPCGS